MKLLSSDDEILRQISVFFSSTNALIFSFTVMILLWSDAYLTVGSVHIYPFFLFLIVFEFIKLFVIVIMFEKDFTVNKKSVFEVLYQSVKFKSAIRAILTLFISCTGYYIIIVLFGAEIFNKIEETLMLSILLTSLTAMPVSIQLGSYYYENFIQRVRPENIFQSLLFFNCKVTLLGAWIGAFVIPLDWDRRWQVWPIPCFLGALFGYVLSNSLYFCILLAMKRRIIKKKGYSILSNFGIYLLRSDIKQRELQE